MSDITTTQYVMQIHLGCGGWIIVVRDMEDGLKICFVCNRCGAVFVPSDPINIHEEFDDVPDAATVRYGCGLNHFWGLR